MIKFTKDRLALIFFAFIVSVVIPGLCRALVLDGVRVGFHKDKGFTRVVLDLEGERSARVYKKSDRVFEVVLPGARLSSGKKFNRTLKKSYVRNITLDRGEKGLKVVITTRFKNLPVRAFYLKGLASDRRGHRLVLDFYKNTGAYRRGRIPEGSAALQVAMREVHKEHVLIAKEKQKIKDIDEKPLLPARPAPVEAARSVSLPRKRPKHSFNPLAGELQNAFRMPIPRKNIAKRQEKKAVPDLVPAKRHTAVQGRKPVSPTKENVVQASLVMKDQVKSRPISDDEPLDDTLENSAEREQEDPEVFKKRILNAEEEISHKRYVEALSLLKPVHPQILDNEWQKRYYLVAQKAAFLSQDYEYAWKNLEILLNRWQKLYIDYPEVLKHAGQCLYYLKKYEKAPHYLLKYYNLYPSDAENDLLLGEVAESLLKLGDKKLAVQMFKFVIDQYKSAEGALISRVRIGELLEEDRALAEDMGLSPDKLYKEVIDISPRSPVADIARAKLASWYYRHQKYQEGAAILHSLARRSIDSTMLLEVRSTMERLLTEWVEELFKKKKYDEIIHVYGVYYSYFDPSIHPEYLYSLAESYRLKGRFSDAIHYYIKALSYGDSLFKDKNLLGLGICYLKLAQPGKALNSLLKVKSPSLLTYSRFFMGKCYIQMKNYEDAVEMFKKAVDGNLNKLKLVAEAQWWMGFAYYQLEKIEDAEICFRKIVSLAEEKKLKLDSTQLAQILYYDASCKIKMNDLKGALSDLKKALPLAKDKKLRKAISENIALIFIEHNSGGTDEKSTPAKGTGVTGSKINKEVGEAIENNQKIKALQKQLAENRA